MWTVESVAAPMWSRRWHSEPKAVFVGRPAFWGLAYNIEVLPEVVRAVRGRVEVYVDGGVRRGTDVVKALALGAKAVFVGRPVFWGLAYNGEAGVRQTLSILREEVDRALALMGCSSIDQLVPEMVVHQDHFSRPTIATCPCSKKKAMNDPIVQQAAF
ncbi:(S)-2-hydroxy-acid oxidase, putative [Ixodes scapularis]|uniref:(S)-2-hydroxy-acid oxidase, putative n=1 Tax=Ixodes scapularis TaxID=6945 RepID=B7QE37_IXOSC|nr:(S)-2-hydroxy-acid oxidase, putative [Ixodes scapularis]|eukprot:XP_002413801.1 (S)-2-hydroxy-acid oxidase, putative [Ixodes scapularis]